MSAIASQLHIVLRDPDDCALSAEQAELRARIADRLARLSAVRGFDRKWTQFVQDEPAQFDEALVRKLYDFYQQWYDEAAEIESSVRQLKEKGHRVYWAGAHRDAREEVRIILRSISLPDLLAAWK